MQGDRAMDKMTVYVIQDKNTGKLMAPSAVEGSHFVDNPFYTVRYDDVESAVKARNVIAARNNYRNVELQEYSDRNVDKLPIDLAVVALEVAIKPVA